MRKFLKLSLGILITALLINCGGEHAMVNSQSGLSSLDISSSAMVPIVNGKVTDFYIYVTNTSSSEINNISWSINKDSSNAFKLIDSSGAKQLEAGQTGQVLVEAEVTSNLSNAGQLEAKLTDQQQVITVPLMSYNYILPKSIDSGVELVIPNVGVFNNVLGHSNYSFYIINQSESNISLNHIGLLDQLPSNLNYQIGQCTDPLPNGGVCQIRLFETPSAKNNNSKEKLTAIKLVPHGVFTDSTLTIPKQSGSELIEDFRLNGEITVLPINSIKIDESNKKNSGIGYIANTGTNPIKINNIVSQNRDITITNKCTTLNPSEICSYSININSDQWTSNANILLTINYSDTFETHTITNITDLPPISVKVNSYPELTFVNSSPIDLYTGATSNSFTIVNSGNVALYNLSVPKINISRLAGTFSFTKIANECPEPLNPGNTCSYSITYLPAQNAEALSGALGNITANYIADDGSSKPYTMTDQIIVNTIFNESLALSFSNSSIINQSKWSDSLIQSGQVIITNTANVRVSHLNFNSDAAWVNFNGCPDILESGAKCTLNVQTTGVKPQSNDSSGLTVVLASYTIEGKSVMSQALSVGYVIKAKPIVTPNISILPASATQINLFTNDTSQAYSFNLTNNTTATNGGNTDIILDLNSLTPSSVSGVFFTVSLTSSPGCTVSGSSVKITSGSTCNYSLTAHSGSIAGGPFSLISSIKYQYNTYSDTSETPSLTTGPDASQGFNVLVTQAQALLNITNTGVNNFYNMQVDSTYANTYKITNVGLSPVVGGLTLDISQLPPGVVLPDLSGCNNLKVSSSCVISLAYLPVNQITSANLNLANINYNNGSTQAAIAMPSDSISAINPGDPSIVVNVATNACGLVTGTNCYVNTRTQASSLTLSVKLTNTGKRVAKKFYFVPNNFNSGLTLITNGCGSVTTPINLDANGGVCSIVYNLTTPSSQATYSLATTTILGSSSYNIGSGSSINTIKISPQAALTIAVLKPTITLLIPNNIVRIETTVPVTLTLSNWFQGGNPSIVDAIDSGFTLKNGSTRSSCTWDMKTPGSSGGVCMESITTSSSIQPTWPTSPYTFSVGSTWQSTDSAQAGTNFQVRSPTYKAIATGYFHTCALSGLSHVFCWGMNQHGELGRGVITNAESFAGIVVGGYSFASISSGANHTCGLTANGTAYCWGLNSSGQLGNGSTQDSPLPVQVPGYTFKQISLGGDTSCGITLDGKSYCWGSNLYGQIGNSNQINQLSPTLVLAGTYAFEQITPGYTHTCGIVKSVPSNSIYCWGLNNNYQLGIGNYTVDPGIEFAPRIATVLPSPAGTISTVTVGDNHSCSLNVTGSTLTSWGANYYGQLGINGSSGQSSPTGKPVIVTYPDQYFSKLTSGQSQSCAISSISINAFCWGRNNYGQLGTGSVTDMALPTIVVKTAMGMVNAISTNLYHTCALNFSGATYCWGLNSSGQLGDRTTKNSTTPVMAY